MGVLSKAAGSLWDWIEAGYPEEVAKRIVSGELPMDEASRMTRAAEQGYGDVLYRGHGTEGISSDADWWASSSPHVAETYQRNLQSMFNEYLDDSMYDYKSVLTELDEPSQDHIKGVLTDYDNLYPLAENEDFINASTDYAYSTKPYMDMETLQAAEADKAMRDALKEANIIGTEITPIRTNASNLAEVNARGKNWRSVETNSNKLKGLQNAESSRGVHKGTDQIAEAVKDSEAYDGVLFKNIDDQASSIPKEQQGDSYNILASRPDVNIRNAELAAFDPQYTGGNIMGGALAAGVGLGALSQSEDADAGAATSLVELILKKHGDDVAGAADELVRMVGFPDSVANRIAIGELPMDAESVARRAQDQGYGDVLYHGSLGDINNLDPRFQGMTNPDADGTGLWMSDEPDVANSFAGDEDYPGGVLYPLRVKSSNPASIDANGKHWEAIPAEVGMKVGNSLLELDGGTLDSNRLAKIAKEQGADSLTFNDMTDGGVYYYGHKKAFDPSKVVASLRTDNVRSPNAAFDPQYTGPNIMGGLLAGGVGLGALSQSEDADAGFITKGGKTLLEAFHGSPHKFDKFSMDQIGTGEGAQAYGHGLYFADSEDVAKGYRDNLKDWDSVFEMNNQLAELQSEIDGASGAKLKKLVSEYEQVAEARELAMNDPGALYRTEIDVTPESLLDWDKPLSEQSELVQGFMNRVAERAPFDGTVRNADGTLEPDASGKMLYEWLYGQRNGPDMTLMDRQANTSRALNKNGIHGIKYLDGASRAAGNGTSNYVIFDDGLINIAERGNADPRLLAGTAAGTAGLLAAPMVKDSGMISAPRSEGLMSFTMGARDLERRLEGSPASLLFPEGVINYLETTNRRTEDPNAMTRAMALLDFL